MIRVAIVEDETLVRIGLKACLEENPEVVVTDVYATAEEAEEGMESSIDILMTDIRLPGKSGLDLMKDCRRKYPKMLFVVLSCYEDFSYAQKAMEFGATRYLLKQELDEEELPDLLLRLAKEKGIQGGGQPETEMGWRTYANKLVEENGFCRVLILWLQKASDDEKLKVEPEGVNEGLICGLIQEFLDIAHAGRIFLYEKGALLALVKIGELEEIRRFLRQVESQINLYTDQHLHVAVSDEVSERTALLAQIEKAFERGQASFYARKGGIYARDLQWKSAPRLKAGKQDVWSNQWRENTEAEIRAFIRKCETEKCSPEHVRETAMRFVQELVFATERFFDAGSEDIFPEGRNPSYAKLLETGTIGELEYWLLKAWKELEIYADTRKNIQYEIKAFLLNHYMEELSQSDVAANFRMSASHFSMVFKQNFGVNYSTYLNRIRMEKAKELLATTKDSAEKIGGKVGMTNGNYFFRLFKKIEGCTVNEYRERYRGKE